MDASLLLEARALVLADLQARGQATPEAVNALEDAVSERGWWADQWPEGARYVAGLVAHDVQDALVESGPPRPQCTLCGEQAPEHPLYISPDLGGPDPVWVCEESGDIAAPLGRL